MFDQFLQDLIAEHAKVAFSEQQFTRFMRLVVGLWNSKSTPSGVMFEPSKASLVQGVLNDRGSTPPIKIGKVIFQRSTTLSNENIFLCLHSCTSVNILEEHVKRCKEHQAQRTVYPEPGSKFITIIIARAKVNKQEKRLARKMLPYNQWSQSIAFNLHHKIIFY